MIGICGMAVLAASYVSSQPAIRSDIVVRHAPYVVSTVSSKTERGKVTCQYCSTSIRYDRTFKWNVYDHVWEETTDQASIPTLCKKCQNKQKAQERLEKQERNLDRKINELDTKRRIQQKKSLLQQLRSEQ